MAEGDNQGGGPELRRLKPTDEVASFFCGDDDLEDFLKTDAPRLEKGDITRVYVAALESRILGYIALSADAIEILKEEKTQLGLKDGDPAFWPALKVGRLAVEKDLQRVFRIGTLLMRTAFDYALEVQKWVGCRLITVDAYPTAEEFYRKLGFEDNQSKKPKPGRQRRTLSLRYDLQRAQHMPWTQVPIEKLLERKASSEVSEATTPLTDVPGG